MLEDLVKYNKEANPQKISDTVIYKYLHNENHTFYCANFIKIESDISNILTRIPAMFSNYTNHDITHSLRVADYMVSLLPAPIEEYSHTELAIMLISAILHDVGMPVSETESSLDITKQDEIRRNHHIRSEEFVLKKASIDYFKIDTNSEVNFQKIVSLIVRSHGEDICWIEKNINDDEEYGVDSINPIFIACLLRLSDYLDFDSRRTPYSLFDYLQLTSVSYEEWRKHFPITNYNKINKERQIYFNGRCEEPEVYHQIAKYFEDIEKEIKRGKLLLFECEKKYKIDISDNILNKIEHDKFSSVNLQFNMDYAAITNILMGENLYSDKTVVIRELLQNSIDACLVKQELYKNKATNYSPEIKIIIDSNKITICDNGVGMTKKVIENYFLCIGKSYYNSEGFKNLNCNYTPISHYGIGFLSSFLLTDKIEITTVPFENNKLKYNFIVKKDDRNVEIKTFDGNNLDSGTTIFFENNYFEEIFSDYESIIRYIKELFFNIPVPISVFEAKTLVEKIPIRNIDMMNRIDISEYLNNVQCSFKTISQKQSCRIIEKLYPFSIYNNYIYDPKHLSDMILDEEDLYNYLKNTNESYSVCHFTLPCNKIQILKIYPLDSYAEDYYENYFEYDDDVQDAFDKTLDKYPSESINILIEDSELLNEFEEYEKIDLSYTTGTTQHIKVVSLIGDLLKKLNYEVDSFLCDIDLKPIFYNNDFYSYVVIDKQIRSMEKNALAFHNIRVGQYRLLIPVLLDSFVPFQWYINVNTNGVFPSVSRDNISSNLSAELGYAIGYAYNKFLYKQEVDPSRKEFINQFLNTYYSEKDKNRFIKNL